ncbi:adenylyltransferase/cytidyltransferase family protein [Candidatus Woesearchaeota archaeon]|nr:adenylyltransferase/cytidyltransferase family protein [Candidatus Woesearchaeota archaeon]
MKKAMVFGTFDVLHPGHLSYFKQAKKLGDYLIVVVARDKTSEKIKGKKPKYGEKIRLKRVKKLQIVDKAVLGFVSDMFKVIKNEKPAVICFGYDQKVEKNLMKKIKKAKIKIKRLKGYKIKKYKSHLMG